MRIGIKVLIAALALAAAALGARVFIGTPASTMTEPFCGG